MPSRTIRTALAVVIALVLGTASAAALQPAGTTADARQEQPAPSNRPDTPPGQAKKGVDQPEEPSDPGDGGEEQPSLAPMDYIAQAPKLSQPVHEVGETEVMPIEAHDGEILYVEITKPTGDGPFPVILEASPYHGTLADRAGTRIFPDPKDPDTGELLGLTGYFAPRGYAVAMMDLRGTGRSTGCLDHLGSNDARDLELVVETLAAQPWSNGRVGMTGHSYVGSTPAVAAAQDPDGLVTIAPSAGLASMYDHQFHNGVPWNLQWIGPMVAYEGLAIDRDLPPGTPAIPVLGSGNPGDNFTYREGQPNPQFGCGLANSAAISGTGQLTGQYEAWHAQRDWRQGAAEADIPIFMIHGVHDNAARIPASEWFFGGRFDRAQDKVWIGQWDHGSTNGRCGDTAGARVGHPTCRFEQFQYALHAWFDHHLMQLEGVDTGPAVEAFLNGEEPIDITEVRDPETIDSKVYATDGWSAPTELLTLHPDASSMTLGAQPPEAAGSTSFQTGAEAVLANVGRGTATFVGEPVEQDTLLLGVSDLTLHASVTNPLTHLVASLWRVDESGAREPVDFCAIQPGLRHGVSTPAPVVPGEVMALDLQCFTVAQWIPAGQHLELDISTGSQHHASFGDTGQVTVHTGPEHPSAWSAPRIPEFTLHDDVPLREESAGGGEEPVEAGTAQAPARGSVVVPAPGAGVIQEPITAAAFEFSSEDGFDNAAVDVVATPTLPSDLDLYLQRQNEDGTWSDDLAAGETGATDGETLKGRLPGPGVYRIVVHNWVGPPNQVEVVVTFLNSAGEAGTADDG